MKSALQFSGGKDSFACLYLLRDLWDELLVVWMNAGAPFPETVVQMEQVRALVPHFHEIKADVLSNIEAHGWPSDVLPVRNAFWGKATTGERGLLQQSWFDCCTHNVWLPMHKAMIDLGITTVYRGQRNSEAYKSPISDGQVADGITYRFPLQNWSEAEVASYLRGHNLEIPAHYATTHKSLDCWCCTAYLDEKLDQLKYLKDQHPEKHAIVAAKLQQMRAAVHRGMEPLEAACS